MCHCAPVFRIHNTASRTRRVGIGLRPGRLSGTFSSGKCSRIRSHCSSRSFNTHTILRHYIDVRNDFEIGSNLIFHRCNSRAAHTLARLRRATTTTREQFVKTRMLELLGLCVLFGLGVVGEAPAAERAPEFTGRWEVTTDYPGGSFVAGLELAAAAGKYTGKSGYLVPDSYWYKYSGVLQKDGLHLEILGPDGKTA